MAQSVLILGAEGFIGSEIRRQLAPNYRLLSVDIRRMTPVESLTDAATVGEQRLERDMGSPDDIDAMWAQLGPELDGVHAVVDLVAHYDFKNKPDARYDRVIEGLEHLLETMPKHLGADVPFLYASSMAAMKPTDPGVRQTADSDRLGAWAYPAHKLAAEDVIERADIDNPRVELVLAGVYSDWCELVPLFNQIELLGAFGPEKYLYPGPVDRGLTYVHVEDVARAFELAIAACFGESGVHRYLIGERDPVTYERIHRAASRAFHDRELPLTRIPKPIAKVGAWAMKALDSMRGARSFIQPWMIDFAGEHFEFDLSATEEALGWSPTRYLGDDIDDMCRRAAAYRDVWLTRNEARPW